MTEFKTPIKNKALDINEKITIPPSPFLNRLGYGTGVSVMQLVRSPRAGQIRSPWALKMLNKRVKPNKVYTDRIKAEADLLQRMSHPNIVGFRAFSKAKILYLGMEACDLSLGDMIEKRIEDDGEPFLPKQILKVASDIASALDYLHTKMQILHGDMKSYNILVNGDFVICKLCDFGVTLPLDENGVFDKRKAGKAVYFGTEAWSAPEVIHGGEISCKTDIWPLGLTLWEMMALIPPHAQTDDDSMDDSVQCLDDTVDSIGDYFNDRYGTRPSVPVNISEKQYAHPLALFYCCTESQPGQRPSARHVGVAARDMRDQCDCTESQPGQRPSARHVGVAARDMRDQCDCTESQPGQRPSARHVGVAARDMRDQCDCTESQPGQRPSARHVGVAARDMRDQCDCTESQPGQRPSARHVGVAARDMRDQCDCTESQPGQRPSARHVGVAARDMRDQCDCTESQPGQRPSARHVGVAARDMRDQCDNAAR